MCHRRRFVASAWVVALVLLTSALTPAAASAQQGSQQRPSLPDEQVTGTEHFLIHYTLRGDAAVSPADADHNGTPDYVERVAAAAEHAWQKEVVDMGWAVPPSDRGEGGDNRIDIYLENDMVDDIAGYTESEGGLVGDNPNTTQVERRAAYSYMSIDKDFASADPAPGETPEQIMQVTIAHEFNHVLQAGYDDFDPQTWLYEATAGWMESQVYPDIADNQIYLPDLLDHPEGCVAAQKNWYGAWLFMQYLSEKFGPDIVRTIWERSGQVDGYQAIDEALAPFKTSLAAEARNFAVTNLLRAYRDGTSYPAAHLGGALDGPGTFAPQVKVQSLGASYIRLGRSGQVSVGFAGRSGLSARVVGVRGSQADVIDLVDGKAEVDLGRYEETYVIVHDDDLATSEARCYASDFAVIVGPADGPSSPVAASWPAANFTPLSTAVTSSSGSSARPDHPYQGSAPSASAQTPDGLSLSFQTIVPTPPDGYTFDYAYIMTPKDFGASAPYYIPDADQSANYDYLKSDGSWLSIAESPTSFKTLQEWEDAIQYQPATKPQTINDVQVLTEDTGTKKHSQYSATFITHGLFIVVDGDTSTDDVMAMAVAVLEKDQSGVTPDAQGGTQIPDPALDTPTPAPTEFYPSGDFPAPNVMILVGVVGVCGLGLCLAGIGVVLVVFIVRGRGKRN